MRIVLACLAAIIVLDDGFQARVSDVVPDLLNASRTLYALSDTIEAVTRRIR